MERDFSKNKDVDKIILQHLDDRDLFQLIPINKYAYSLTDENFWRSRLISKYLNTIDFKKDETWKEYYLSVVYYIDVLKSKYNYSYIKGDPKYIYTVFKQIEGRVSYSASKQKEFYQHGYEDLSLIFANRLKREFGYPEFQLNTPEWQEYKEKFLI